MSIEIDQIAQLIKDVGFPIFVSAYLLIRIEKKLDQVIIAINGQTRISNPSKNREIVEKTDRAHSSQS